MQPIVLIDDGFATAGNGTLQQALSELPQWRREKAEAYRQPTDKMQCAQAYLLLCRGLKEHFGINAMPRFGFKPNGKPYLKEYPLINFNLSHCKSAVMCVISNGAPVGCDIETTQATIEPEVMRLCLSQLEQSLVTRSADPCVEFTKLWTRKEALLKLTGDGLSTDNLTSLLDSDLAHSVTITTTVPQYKDYVYSICTHKQ